MKKTDFDRSLQARHGYNSYKSHFKPLYLAVGGICWLLLAASAFFSAQWFAGTFSAIGEGALIVGAVASVIVALFIHLLTEKSMVYYDHQGMIEPVLGLALLFLVGLNAYGDFQGASRWGSEYVGEAPEDTKTGGISDNYNKQIDGIDKKIDGIEAFNFHWCEEHSERHKCDNPDNKPYINKSEKSDRKAVRDIEKLNAQRLGLVASMDSLTKVSMSEFSGKLSTHKEELKNAQTSMRGASVACMVLFMVLSYWRHGYGKKAIEEMGNTSNSEPETVDAGEAEVVEDENPKQIESPSPALLAERDKAIEESQRLRKELQDENRRYELLMEELKATHEAREDFFDGGDREEKLGK